jgi:hypothetical protein
LGLTGGILDAFVYGNALTRVLIGGEPDSLLTECASSRRDAWLETTNMLSMANMKRLYGFDEESVKAREGFFHLLKTDASFPTKVQKDFDKMMPDSFEKSLSASERTEPGSGTMEKPVEERMEAVRVS